MLLSSFFQIPFIICHVVSVTASESVPNKGSRLKILQKLQDHWTESADLAIIGEPFECSIGTIEYLIFWEK